MATIAGTDPNESSSPTLRPGERAGGGRFRLERLIGRGGMGTVWQAHDERLKETVALKFISERIRGNSMALGAMRRETSRSHSLSHHSIVRIHDLHEVEGEPPFISMEFIQGNNLHELRSEPGRAFAMQDVWRWTRQLCSALIYAHSRGVIHRDLKPANLMIDASGELKLADFGLAAALRDSADTQNARGSGTPAYMSPQQFAGGPPAATDDIYSLGACLFELLAGAPVFERPDFRRQIELEPAPLLSTVMQKRGVSGEVPEAFEDLIHQCLSKNPANRPQSAQEFLDRASEALAENSGAAATPAPWKRRAALAAATLAAAAFWIMAAGAYKKHSRAPLLNLKSAVSRASSFAPPCLPALAFDGVHRILTLETTRWVSQTTPGTASEWVAVDLGRDMAIESIVIDWELAYAKDFTIRTRTSEEGFVEDPLLWKEQGRIMGLSERETWIINEVRHQQDTTFDFAAGKASVASWLKAERMEIGPRPVIARHVMVNPTARGANNAGVYSIYEVKIAAKPAP